MNRHLSSDEPGAELTDEFYVKTTVLNRGGSANATASAIHNPGTILRCQDWQGMPMNRTTRLNCRCCNKTCNRFLQETG